MLMLRCLDDDDDDDDDDEKEESLKLASSDSLNCF